jgi:hypothetical protein
MYARSCAALSEQPEQPTSQYRCTRALRVLARAHGVCVSRACVRVCLRPCAGSAAAYGGLRERVGGRFRGKGGWAWCGQPAGADDDPCTARKWATWRSSCEGSVGGVGEVGATCPGAAAGGAPGGSRSAFGFGFGCGLVYGIGPPQHGSGWVTAAGWGWMRGVGRRRACLGC